VSYDVSLTVSTGAGREVEVWSDNYTSNVSGMWARALELPEQPWVHDGQQVIGSQPRPDGGWEPVPLTNHGVRLLDGAPAVEAAGILSDAVRRMAADPEPYRAMNPASGWGDYDGALAFLRGLAAACAEHPAGTIRVSS